MHIGKGRRNPLHVDYIFLGACMAYIQDSLFEAILSHPRLDLSRKIAVVKALGKVIWIQNDLFAKWHSLDGLEYQQPEADADDIELAAEREGYLNGKRFLGKDNASSLSGGSGSSSADDASSLRTTSTASSSGKTSLGRPLDEAMHLGRCPFSGIMRRDDRSDEQRATATRSPRPVEHEHGDEATLRNHKTGTPKVRILDGKTVGKENLDQTVFDE